MKKLIFLLGYAWISLSIVAQSDSAIHRLGTFVKNIQAFNHLYPQEKVYLHFDNTGYFLGETIWFKAYVTTATGLTGTPMSRVLYVELLNAEGRILETRKLLIENGQAHGDIALTKANMKSGYHEIRAYTRIMLNWDQSALFSRVFPVFETPQKDGDYAHKTIRIRPYSEKTPTLRESAPDTKKINMEFFPEGGTLVQGLSSIIAFKITDQEGKSLNTSGILCNKKGDTLSTFAANHKGMGYFGYTPDGTSHQAIIYLNNKRYGFPLPEAKTNGYVMQITTTNPEELQMKLKRPEESLSSDILGLTINCRGKVYVFKTIHLQPQENQYLLRIPRSELPTGINQFTLFTHEGKIVADRMVFINQGKQLHITARQNKNTYQAFEPIQMEFRVHDTEKQPVHTTFSLSVRDEDTEIPTSHQGNILTNLLLASDLKGFIETPDYYFESNDKAHALNLDLLMLTQGYRRYEWAQMAEIEAFTVHHKIEKGILIDGTVKSLILKRENPNIEVNMRMFSETGLFQKATCMTDSIGNFNFLAEDFFGKWNLQLESKRNDKRREKWITLNRLFTPRGRTFSYYDTFIPQSTESKSKGLLKKIEERDEISLQELKKLTKGARKLKEVEVKEKRQWETLAAESASILYDVAEEEDKLEDAAKGYNESLYEFLYRINPYFSYGNGGRYPVTYKGRPVDFIYEGARSNEVPVDFFDSRIHTGEKEEDMKHILHRGTSSGRYGGPLSSSEITTIAIIEQANKFYQYFPYTNWNVNRTSTIIYVKIDSDRVKNHEPVGVRLTSLQGFSQPRNFYNPNYKNYRLPDEEDYRRTLYWNPDVTTDAQGEATVTFYNNGTCKKMNISAETVTSQGVPGFYQNK